MHPILFQIFSLKVHTYGLFMGLGFLLALHLALSKSEDLGIREDDASHSILLALVGGIAGARLLFVIVDSPLHFLRHPWEIFMVWKGGLVYLGGFLLAFLLIARFARKKGYSPLQLLDLLTPPLVIGHAMGRLGCFMAGCCYGKSCELPWAVTFTDPAGVGLKHVALHPTQIYSGLFLVALYFTMLFMRRYKQFHGFLFLAYMAIYSVGRSLIETLRNDFRGEFMGLSTAQAMSIPIFILTVAYFIHCLRLRQRARALTS